MLTGIIGVVFCCISPLILQSAFQKQEKSAVAHPAAPDPDAHPEHHTTSEVNPDPDADPDLEQHITLTGMARGLSQLSLLFKTVPRHVMDDPWKTVRHVTMGSVGGLLYGVAGVGPVLMTYLAIATPFLHAECVAAAMLAHYPRVLVGLATHLHVGNVAWAAVPPLLVGTSLGGWYGANVLTTVPEAPLKAAFGGIVGVLGARQVFGVWKAVRKLK